MNIQEYISSGIVESYVLGLADGAERAEFERMCKEHPEVKAALEAFEIALEKNALAAAVKPPEKIKNKIFAELGIDTQQKFTTVSDERKEPGEKKEQAVVVSSLGWVRYLAAASVVLLVASTALNFYFFKQYKDYSSRYADLLASQSQLAENNRVLNTKLNNYENTIAMMKDPNMAAIRMEAGKVPDNGSPDASSMATVLWDSKSKDVFLMINNLPQPGSDQQYQLWAIVDGKPVDAGVFDMNDTNSVIKMKNIPRAQAFAVTLEKKGGNTTPQGKMYVLGVI